MTRNTLTAMLAGAIGALALAGTAAADPAQSKALVDAAKTRGEVGEQYDGYLGFVTSVSDPALKAAVAEINAGRAQLYRQAAARNNVTPEAAGVSAFKTLVEAKIAPGEYYKMPEGAWVKK
ncbi:MAG: YdbL family protein [Phenylobacterium sp.]|uniref:YdbL family protein n=1 Tax=Phenylobacterium sp. TaxID=1871053 RepID=UPI00391D5DCB